METTEILIDKLFNNLDNWRNLPAYQLERRADIFFSLYLEKIILDKLNYKLDVLIPEFPIRIGSIDKSKEESNQSFKIDYLAICENYSKFLFIELKTDSNSVNNDQWKYLKLAKSHGIFNLLNDISKINKASAQKVKYGNLQSIVDAVGEKLSEARTNESEVNQENIKIVYIAPNDKGFTIEMAENCKIVTFSEIADLLDKEGNFLSLRFANSLRKWTQNPNKKYSQLEAETVEIEYHEKLL